MPSACLGAIEARIAAAERALIAATGGANVCRFDRAGRATGGMKYDEGCLVALRAARRLVQADTARARVLVGELADRWHADLLAQQARAQPSPLWIAYTQGGADALAQLVARASEERDG